MGVERANCRKTKEKEMYVNLKGYFLQERLQYNLSTERRK